LLRYLLAVNAFTASLAFQTFNERLQTHMHPRIEVIWLLFKRFYDIYKNICSRSHPIQTWKFEFPSGQNRQNTILEERDFVNLALKIQCNIVKNTLIQTAILPTAFFLGSFVD